MSILALAALGACGGHEVPRDSFVSSSAGQLAEACADDSLRPSAAGPAEGLWLYEQASSRERVEARIGPGRPDDRARVVTRPVETMEVSEAGDTIRLRLDAATVSLQLLPAPTPEPLAVDRMADSTVRTHPVATYSPSPRVRLAAYEPCVTRGSGPRIRYLRRDTVGRIVTDVMLQRASDR